MPRSGSRTARLLVLDHRQLLRFAFEGLIHAILWVLGMFASYLEWAYVFQKIILNLVMPSRDSDRLYGDSSVENSRFALSVESIRCIALAAGWPSPRS